MDEWTDEDALEIFLKVRGYSAEQIAEVKASRRYWRKKPAGKAKTKTVTPEKS